MPVPPGVSRSLTPKFAARESTTQSARCSRKLQNNDAKPRKFEFPSLRPTIPFFSLPPGCCVCLPFIFEHFSYEEASRVVLEESRLSATDTVRQFAITFFDNKFSSLIPLKIAYFLGREDSLDAMDFYTITVKVSLLLLEQG